MSQNIMSPPTPFLSRLIGLYSVLASLSMITHKQDTLAIVNALIHTPPVLLLVGVITLVAGLAIVLGHNIWSGGVLPVIITLVGWFTLIKGLLLLFLSPEAVVGVFGKLHYQQRFYLYILISLILGVYLTYEGFRPGRVSQNVRDRRALAA
jgi:vacuolar-type H+-ATPase subunit I/STV1